MSIFPSPTHFDGFPRDFADFLFSLRFNNTVDLLPENKMTYKRLITDPLALLFNDLVKVALSVSVSLIVKPSKCVSTMYSDMRFSRATPLKEYMYIRFREPAREKDIIGLYFDMGCEGYSYGIRIYNQTSEGIASIREGVLTKKREFGRELERLKRLGMTIIGDKYAKDHYPEVKEQAVNELLNMRNFHMCWDRTINEAVFGRALLEEISGAYTELGAMFALLKQSLRPGGEKP